MNVHLTADRTNLLSTPTTVFFINSRRSTETAGEFKDVGNFWRANYEVCAAAKRLTMNTSTHIVNSLKKGFIPFRNVTGELWVQAATKSNTCLAINKLAWAAAPEHFSTGGTSHEVGEDFLINLKSNLLRKNTCQLNFGVKVMISIQILGKLGAPFSLQLLGHRGNSYRINLDVNFWDAAVIFQAPRS